MYNPISVARVEQASSLYGQDAHSTIYLGLLGRWGCEPIDSHPHR
ncbi:hypothetical protein [Phormidesmis priestleyi]|nr:hypothetical protein [Phormidesmis priestleyi]